MAQRSPSGTAAAPSARPPFFQLIPSGTHIDFVSRFRLCASLSIAIIAIGAAAVPLRGLQLGVDFTGGHHILVRTAASPAPDEGALRSALAEAGLSGASVVRQGGVADQEFQVRLPAEEGENPVAMSKRVEQALAPAVGAVEIERADFVGARVGAELRSSAFLSLGLAFAAIFGYVALRFSASYAPGAIIALVHDVLVTAGVFVVFGWQFDLNVVAALLTIVGYSINDTIVVYDRIRELRERRSSAHLADVVNTAINDTLSRTLLTSGTTLIAVLSLLLLGGHELRGFSSALVIGILVGTYSSVYVASPIMIWLEERWSRGDRAGQRGSRATAAAR